MPHSETWIDGIWYPSVTTIMGAKPMPWLDAWKEKWGILALRKTRMSGAIGTEFHRCIDSYINTGDYAAMDATIDGSPLHGTARRVAGMMRSFVRWAQSVEASIHHTERKIVSRKYVYSGTLDAVGTLGRKPMLFDWKSSSRIYDDMQLQLAAYAEAYNEENHSSGMDIIHKDVKDGMIVDVAKKKPHFRLTAKQFKLGKRPFRQFLKLRAKFDDMKAIESGVPK